MSTSTIALYPGTFDPIHNGHLDIARRSLAMFDRLIIAVYDQPDKKLMLSHDQRVALARATLKNVPGHERALVMGYSGLTVNFAKSQGATAMVRGLRNAVDFDYELQLAQTNHWLTQGREIESVFLFANAPNHFLSATLVRQVATLGGDVTDLVPPEVARALSELRKIG